MELNLDLIKKLLNEEIDGRITVDEKKDENKPKPIEKQVEPVRPKRCQQESCKVKIMLADFPCKCKQFYCSQHRYSESHGCKYDYMTSGKEILAKQLVEVKGNRLQQI